jgi:4-coumarate--CoA ligase
VAVGLAAKGVRPGDKVLLFSGNSIYFPSVFLGVLMAGAVFTGANPGFVPRELAYQIKDSGAVIVLAAAASLDTALEAAAEVGLPASSVYVFDTTIPDAPKPESPPTKGARHWTELIGSKADGNAFSWTEPADASSTICCLSEFLEHCP